MSEILKINHNKETEAELQDNFNEILKDESDLGNDNNREKIQELFEQSSPEEQEAFLSWLELKLKIIKNGDHSGLPIGKSEDDTHSVLGPDI